MIRAVVTTTILTENENSVQARTKVRAACFTSVTKVLRTTSLLMMKMIMIAIIPIVIIIVTTKATKVLCTVNLFLIK